MEKLNKNKDLKNQGPRSELEYWKKILQEITLLSELSRTSYFLQIKNYLIEQTRGGRSDESINNLITDYKKIDNQLTEKLNEAKDNVKYLTTLEKFIEPLYTGTPEEIIETLPALMNAIKMIHTIARYYNSSNKLTNLFVKITNQMIINCKNRIKDNKSDNEIWNKDPNDVIEILNSCIILCQKYKSQYQATKKKALELPKGKRWDFDDNVIFGKFDVFIKRVKKLIEIFSTIIQFKGLEQHNNLDGMTKLTDNFKKLIESFKNKNPSLLVGEMAFDKDYVNLIQEIQKLDSELQTFIDDNFSKFRNISYTLKLLKKFDNIMKRDTIRNRLNSKYDTVLQNYGSEIDGIQKLFQENRQNPPFLRNMPSDAGRIIWVRHLFAKLNGPIEEFPSNIINIKDMKKYIEKFNLLGKDLIMYELYYTHHWCNDIERAKGYLQSVLLVMKDENGQKKIKVNFDKEIQKLIREAKALDREGIANIPESAKIILLQEDKFKRYYFELDYIKSEYERIILKIKPIMKNLLIPHVENLDLKLRPGMVTLTWTSMNIDGFLQQVQMSLYKLEQLIISINDIIENRIENNLKVISKILLVKLPQDGKPLSLDDFVEDQQKHIQEQAEMLISKNIEIERAVDDLLLTVSSYELDDNIEKIDNRAAKLIKQYYFWYLYQALLNSTQNSLISMKDRVCGKKGEDNNQILKPFFEVYLTLENGEVNLDPNIDEIQKSINKAARAVLSCSKKLLGWDQIVKNSNEKEEKESYYKIIAQDKEIVKVILLLTGSIQGTKNNVNNFLKDFEDFKWLWKDNIEESLKKFSLSNPQLQDYEKELKKFSRFENKIDQINKTKEIGAMALKTEKLINSLKEKCKQWRSYFSQDLHKKAKELLYNLTEKIKSFNLRLGKEVKDIDSLGNVMGAIEDIRYEQSFIDLEFNPVLDMYSLLDNSLIGGITDKEEIESRQLLKKRWNDLIKFTDERHKSLQQEQGKYLSELKKNINKLIDDVKHLRKNFEEKGPKVKGITPREASDRLKSFANEYQIKNNDYEINRKGENLFGLKNQEYPELEQTKKDIKNLKKLYDLYNKLNETTLVYEEENWNDINSEKIEEWKDQIQKFSDDCLNLPNDLREWQAYRDLKEKIDNYKEILPFIKDLKEEYFRLRHWEKIKELAESYQKNVNFNFFITDNFFFKDVISAKLLDFQEELEDIIDSAKKQEKIEKQKIEIEERWLKTDFSFKQWGTRQINILMGSSVEDIQTLLDEDISTLSGLSAMRHCGPFKDGVKKIMEELLDVYSTLDLWVKVQILWTSLESVFTGGDIAKHLATEAKKFSKIDGIWKKTIMYKAVELKRVRNCCRNDIIKSNLPNLQNELEACQKQLEKYLEQKRKEFPRFYFVSDPVLLKFLSQGSDPESIQEDLDKLFDAISKVTFEKGEKRQNEKKITEIKGTLGGVDEEIPLLLPVVCKGNIETWLRHLEEEMKNKMKDLIRNVYYSIQSSWKDNEKAVLEFIRDNTAQCALIGIQMKFTKLVQDVLEKKLSERAKLINEVRNEISNTILNAIIKKCKTDIQTTLERQKIETMVTIQVYLKEVVTAWKFRDKNDFDWLKYTRIYWKEEGEGNCVVCITDWEEKYSYEYLGIKERLCITPLTDRCYITLAQAMSMFYGGAPAGPAGTGKTETVKDMGRTLGIFVVVTNCSGEHRYTDMAKIFKGLCQSGLWGCFDEFNRIDLEVLSVVAMQVESITSAKKNNAKEFFFPNEPNKIGLRISCGYFITMNPGYAGRQELPENLKVLFRGVTMMVPDREVIIRVKLASCGYEQYMDLAKKFKVLYNLCEEQLSKQRFYDFGLRNILSVLRTAGNVLRTVTDKKPDEEFLLRNTLLKMNLSKLVSQDVPLFKDLIQDIFKKEEDNKKDKKKNLDKIETKIIEKVKSKNLIDYDPWLLKINQLYETKLVRHGFMTVGSTATGKSSIIQILTDILSEIEEKHQLVKLNPKSFTSQEMYGVKNNLTGEWTTGIFSELWRKINEKKANKTHYWIICDGPVDAIWIENLNTVLDDNKVLTLANGDRIFMLDTCKLVFEVENLNNASPATVSRVGMVYLSPDDLSYTCLYQGWIKQRNKDEITTFKGDELELQRNYVEKLFNKEDAEKINNIFKKYFVDLKILEAIEKITLKNPIIYLDNSLKVLMTLNLLNGLLLPILVGKNSIKTLSENDFEKIILFSILWGVAGIYELNEKKEIIEFMKNKKDFKIPLPKYKENETPFDYIVKIDERNGAEWDLIKPPEWIPPKQIQFSRLLMPTLDSIRAEYLINYISLQPKSSISTKSVLLIGGSGTAKTSTILIYANKFNNDEMLLHRNNFSSATQPVHFQTSIDSVCETKIRKGYGPKDGKLMTVFIDDFSMPEKNEWGDQITLEIVRQLMEQLGFYKLEKNERGNFKFIENLQFLCSMNHPGGGRNDIPNRLKRQFFIFNMILPSRIDIIYDPILLRIFDSKNYKPELIDIVKKLSLVTIKLWNKVKDELKPSPSKFHYLFNLRDVSRIFKGITQITPNTVKNSNKLNKDISSELFLIALWKHESERVFADKLINKEDKEKVIKFINENCCEVYSDLKKEIIEKLEKNTIYFTNFLNEDKILEDNTIDVFGEKIYEGIMDIEKLRNRCYDLQNLYNNPPSNWGISMKGQKKSDLVLFNDALSHLVKISRIIQMKRSSALLVGVGGSGKQSLTRLAAFIGRQEIRQIILTKGYNEANLKEDIKNLFDEAGHKNKNVAFILTDSEVKNENFLEYINMVLSTGEIPGLIPKDEKEIWMGDVKTEYCKNHKNKEPTNIEIYDYFLNRLRDNLHIILCFSPVGTKFRDRSRKFPALFNECSIDWFLQWPEDALANVAEQSIQGFKIVAKNEVMRELPKWIANCHIQTNEVCEEYFNKMRRRVYVTPKSYLSFIKSFKKLYQEKLKQLDFVAKNFKKGLNKIEETNTIIQDLKKKLEIEELKLQEKRKQVDKLNETLKSEKKFADKKNEEVSKEKKEIEQEKEQIEIEKEICIKQVEEALPALLSAQSLVKGIKPTDLANIKTITKKFTHPILRYIADVLSLCLYKNIGNEIKWDDNALDSLVKDGESKLYFLDSYEKFSKFTLSDNKLLVYLRSLTEQENENMINSEILELIEPYTKNSKTWFNYEIALKIFGPVATMQKSTMKLEEFSKETMSIKPKKKALQIQSEKLQIATNNLKIAIDNLEKIKKKCNELDEEFKKNNDEKNKLEEEAKAQKKKIEQAEKLISSLSGEKDRWSFGLQELNNDKDRLVGNVGLATSFISYCGPFNSEFRDLIANDFLIGNLRKKNIPFLNTIYQDLTNFLVDEATIGQWNLDGLPKDVLSIQNGIMVESSDRYILMIDPQGQGSYWIKNKYNQINPETGNSLIKITTLNEKKFKDILVNCVEGGEVLIIEGIEGEVDPILDPLLEKQIIEKKSSRIKRIEIGGQIQEYDDNFLLFMTCKLGNPKFSPELSAKTTIIDFTVTQIGLEQQLLSVVLTEEQKSLEDNLNNLLREVTDNKKHLKNLDDKLLKKLCDSTGNLLEDADLVEILNDTKTQVKEMTNKLQDAEINTKEINESREIYRPVAIRGSVLYFCMIEIAQVNWMYNSSLSQFLSLYLESIKTAINNKNRQKRVENITNNLTYITYRYVNRGLFEKDKNSFKIMVCFKILLTAKVLSSNDISLFLKAGSIIDKNSLKPKPSQDWLDENAWKNITALSQHKFGFDNSPPLFKSLPENLSSNLEIWKNFSYNKSDPENHPIPEFEERIKSEKETCEFLRLCLIRCVREDRTIIACNNFIENTLGGKKYTEPVTDAIESINNAASPVEPILFLLSAGADPTSSIDDLANKKKKILKRVSLGEGQEEKAEELIKNSYLDGDWVLLQNCHLGLEYMKKLDSLMEDTEYIKVVNPDFRIWMSCESREGFPLGLLQKAVKVTNEPPQGLKAGLSRTFETIVNSEFLERIDHQVWRNLCYIISFLHSIVQERRKFGPLGWCVPYEFNNSDLEASLAFVDKYLNQLINPEGSNNSNQNVQIHYPTLIYIICQIQYGGKITDNLDRELFQAYGEKFLCDSITSSETFFAKIQFEGKDFKYTVCNALEHKIYISEITKLPGFDSPEIFGLSGNADLTFRLKETKDLINTIMETRPKEGSSGIGLSPQEIVKEKAKTLSKQLNYNYPELEVKELISKLGGPKKDYPKTGIQVPLNIFLSQEIQRMQMVLNLVNNTFIDIVDALDGKIIMTPEIVSAIDSISDGKIPLFWVRDASGAEISWIKPTFSTWYESLLERNYQLNKWLREDRPRYFNIGLFFNPQGFLTAMKQEVVRMNKLNNLKGKNSLEWTMDNVDYNVTVFKKKEQNDYRAGKDINAYYDGVLIKGLYLEGACWKDSLADFEDKKMTAEMNIIYVTALPLNHKKNTDNSDKSNLYFCPVYKYPCRTDQYIIFRVYLPCSGSGSSGTGDSNKWKLKGVALLCSLDK